jgi:SAM-dependent methyltransferase
MYAADLAHIHHTAFGGFADAVAPEVRRILKRAGIVRGRIVEIGCGSGRLARRLSAAGYDVRGFDISPAMVRLARTVAPRARFGVGSLTRIRIPRCDAVIALGEVVTYAPGGLAALSRFFTRVHDALPPGGLLIFDFMESAAGRTYAPKTLIGDGWTMTVAATFDSKTRVLRRRIIIVRRAGRASRRSRETHRVRIYGRREIRTALARAGFTATMRRSFGSHRLLRGDVAVVARRAD